MYAAIGLRAHSGWAAAVAIGGPAGAPVVIARRRIQMTDRTKPGPTQPYHAAVGLDLLEAQRVVSDCAERAASLAAGGLRALQADLRALGHEVSGAGLLLASGRPLPGLEAILASHPLLHAAEGELFREALRVASRQCGIPLTTVRERDLFSQAPQLEQRVAAMGKGIGPPWRQDEKFAAAAAWLALALKP